MNEIWSEFENCLKNAGNVSFWWRDDDIRVKKNSLLDFKYWKYFLRLEKLLKLLNKYDIPSIFGIIPYNYLQYGKRMSKLLKKYGVYVTVHGIEHISKSVNGKSEFPDDCDVEGNLAAIVGYQKSFKEIFKDKLLPVFIAPYNNICDELKNRLLESGFRYVSTSNMLHSEHNDYDIDIDFVDWDEFRVKDEAVILKEIMDLINSGVKVIGINSHHKMIKHEAFAFFDKFFEITTKSNNVKWVNPLI